MSIKFSLKFLLVLAFAILAISVFSFWYLIDANRERVMFMNPVADAIQYRLTGN